MTTLSPTLVFGFASPFFNPGSHTDAVSVDYAQAVRSLKLPLRLASRTPFHKFHHMDLQLALWGFFWGSLSAVSLPLGAVLGLWSQPKRKVVSSLMAFGGGALLFALTIELFGHALHESSDAHGKVIEPGLILATMLGALAGGLLFQLLNSILSNNGAHVRKRSLARRHIARMKRRRARLLLRAFHKSQMLQSLETDQVIRLAEIVTRKTYPDGTVLLKKGTRPRPYIL